MGKFKLKKLAAVVKKVATPKNLAIAASIGVTGGLSMAALSPGGITGALGKVAGKMLSKQQTPEESFPSVRQDTGMTAQPTQAQAAQAVQQTAQASAAPRHRSFWDMLFGRKG